MAKLQPKKLVYLATGLAIISVVLTILFTGSIKHRPLKFEGEMDQTLVERATAYAELMGQTKAETALVDFSTRFEEFLAPDFRGGNIASTVYGPWTSGGMTVESSRLAMISRKSKASARVYLELELSVMPIFPTTKTIGSTWNLIDGQWYLDGDQFLSAQQRAGGQTP